MSSWGKSTLLRCITNLEGLRGYHHDWGDTLVETPRRKVIYADKETTARITQKVGLVFKTSTSFPTPVLRITELPATS